MSYSIKGKPWTYKGSHNVENCKTSADVMSAAGLDWNVAKCKLVAQMPWNNPNDYDGTGFNYAGDLYKECPNAYATYRTDTNTPLGIVKERYTPVQNIEAFNFFDDAIGKNKAIWQTAGWFGNGERIFVSAKLPKTILVGGKDPVENYLVFTTSHDGSSGVKILFTNIRIVCENTLNLAITESERYISFRHTKSVHNSLSLAAEILEISNKQIDFANELYTQMMKEKIKDEEAQTLFANIILNENEKVRVKETGHTLIQLVNRDWKAIADTEISMKKINVMSEMNNYYFTGPGQREYLGTKWGAYNAVTGYYSNVDNNNGIKRMDSLLYGDRARKIELATSVLTI